MKEEIGIASTTTEATMPVSEAVAGVRLLLDYSPNPKPYVMVPREALASLLRGIAAAPKIYDKYYRLKSWMLKEFGTIDPAEASVEIKRWRDASGFFTFSPKLHP